MTPEQQQAIKAARRAVALEQEDAGDRGSDYWRGYLRGALKQVAGAFPEEATP